MMNELQGTGGRRNEGILPSFQDKGSLGGSFLGIPPFLWRYIIALIALNGYNIIFYEYAVFVV